MFTLFPDRIEGALATSEDSFQKGSKSDTQLFASSPLPLNEPKLISHPSQHTLPETLPFNSRALDFQDAFPTVLEQQVAQLQARYQGIHGLLIGHSEYESGLHQRRRNYKAMTVDRNCLSRDYSNKLHLIGEITALVESIGVGEEGEEMLETKFQEYYLQRHYGGLSCDFGNLSIQDRLETSKGEGSFCVEMLSGEEGREVLSRIGNYESLIPQSRITYSEQFCQTGDWEGVVVQVAQLVEVQVPIIVYRLKEVVVRCQESELLSQFGNIDEIITRYSKPYEDLYGSRHEDEQKHSQSCLTPDSTPLTCSPSPEPAPSMLMQSALQRPQTEVQLAYSDFPEEERFKLPLDSYAQIESLISNESGGIGSRPASDRATPRSMGVSPQGLMITEKVVNRSVLQRLQQNERALAEENGQLRESIGLLQGRVAQGERRVRELQLQNGRLAGRLQEEIQQSEYFAGKLQELNAELLEEKVQCLTHLNESKQRKIDMLTVELAAMGEEEGELRRVLAEVEKDCQRREEMLHLRQEEISSLSRAVFEKEQELNELTSCEENVVMMAGEAEMRLRQEIDKLQREKSEMRESIKEYEKRLLDEGLSLQYEEASEIQGIIEAQQHNFGLELQQINEKYDRLLTSYQLELNELKKEIQQKNRREEESVKRITESDRVIEQLQIKQVKSKMRNEEYCLEIEAVIGEYDRELQMKDEEIIALKKQHAESKNQEVKLVTEQAYQFIIQLQGQLAKEREEKRKISLKLNQLEVAVRQGSKSNGGMEAQLRLIEELSDELQRKLEQNRSLKGKIEQQSQQLIKLSCFQGNLVMGRLQDQNKKLRRVNGKLKRYMTGLQQEIRAVWAVDGCDVHKKWIEKVIQERDYYLREATGEEIVSRG